MTLLEALDDAQLFAPLFGPSWRPWRAFLAALDGLPLEAEALALYRECTGRETAPTEPAREAWVVCGRRAGKSRVAALLAVYAAAFMDWRPHLAAGEVATVAIIAADRKQARVAMRYVAGLFEAVPMLAALVTKRTASSLELGSRRVVVEVHTASFRTTRGYSFALVVADECAFWNVDAESAEPDTEVLAALRPALATLPGARLIAVSSPYARAGALWQAYEHHHGRDGDPVLVWQAPTRTMNATVPAHVVEAALEADESAARAEWLAEFRVDVERFVAREVVDAVTVPGRHELPPLQAVQYIAFCDPSGGSQDAMTLAVAHGEADRVVLDCVRERRPPFSPDDVVRDFAETLRAYWVSTVTGDRYGGEWPRERFREHGIHYEPSAEPKSAIYAATLPLLNAGRVELLDVPRLKAQLLGLERRTARGGRDSIDHGPRAHDDVVNAAAGALTLAWEQGQARGEVMLTQMRARRRLEGGGFDVPLTARDMPL